MIDDVHLDPIFVFRFFGCDRGRPLLEPGQSGHIRGAGQLALGRGHATMRTFEGAGAEIAYADLVGTVPERIDLLHENGFLDDLEPRFHIPLRH